MDQPLSLLQRFADTFIKDVNLGVLIFNTSFELVEISEMACRLLGLSREKVIGRQIEEIFAALPRDHQLIDRSVLHGTVMRNQALSWSNGHERFELLVDSDALRDHAGKVVGAYMIFKDVTNLRSLEQQVRRSDRLAMIGQIAAGTAHEIRNPLTSVKGFLQLFRKTFGELGLTQEQAYSEMMLKEIDRINELVNEFLLLSKPKDTVFEPVNISEVLNEILPFINNEALLHNITLQHEVGDESLPNVVASKELLKQVFLNLCKNGIEAMGEEGCLTIRERLDLENACVAVDIHDTGPGIPFYVIDKIFDPFFTTKDEGTGLGLSVCQRIIHDVGGQIRVSSKGFGTTFTVSIPIP